LSEKEETELLPFFGKEGYFAQHIEQYEDRPSQKEVSLFIEESLKKEEHAFVEAGTGTGKSIAYLLPAFLYAAREAKKGAISTETKALQHQLLFKEIPLLQKIFHEHFERYIRVELCLGSANYLCQRRFESHISSREGGRDTKPLETIGFYLEKGRSFSRFDITISDSTWNHINRQGEFCLRNRCGHFASCPYQNARKNWQNADILIINHYLFFSNIGAGKSFLPYTDFVVFDEAHSISDICCKQMGFTLGTDYFKDEISPVNVRELFRRMDDSETAPILLDTFERVYILLSDFFFILRAIAKDRSITRLTKPLLSALNLEKEINSFIRLSGDIDEEAIDKNGALLFDGLIAAMTALQKIIVTIAYPFEGRQVIWLEQGTGVLLKGQPIDPVEIFQKEINSYYQSLIFTSATLAVQESFDFIKMRTGVESERTLLLQSDYNYKENVLIYIPKKNYSYGDMAREVEHICTTVRDIGECTGGSLLVLFNSYMMLEACESILESEDEFNIISQSEYSAFEAVELYKKEENALLLGTHSFWQGIDLPGKVLKGVVITRLPFDPPDRPDIQGAEELFKSMGKSPFESYHLPRAVIKFRQGFGRLIRTSEDAGIVALTDSRVIEKGYGKLFLNSIPECRISSALDDVEAFCIEKELDHH
jgi:ATP-dependent DNA helicase DinG